MPETPQGWESHDGETTITNEKTTIGGELDACGQPMKVKCYKQETEPELEDMEFAVWKDTLTNKKYMICKINDEQSKVEIS